MVGNTLPKIRWGVHIRVSSAAWKWRVHWRYVKCLEASSSLSLWIQALIRGLQILNDQPALPNSLHYDLIKQSPSLPLNFPQGKSTVREWQCVPLSGLLVFFSFKRESCRNPVVFSHCLHMAQLRSPLCRKKVGRGWGKRVGGCRVPSLLLGFVCGGCLLWIAPPV